MSAGSVERDERQRLTAFIATTSPLRSLQEFNERVGFASFEMVSEDTELSRDVEQPTLFTFGNVLILPRGERILNLLTWRHIELPTNVTCSVTAQASGSYRERVFSGAFVTKAHYSEMNFEASMTRIFQVHLA